MASAPRHPWLLAPLGNSTAAGANGITISCNRQRGWSDASVHFGKRRLTGVCDPCSVPRLEPGDNVGQANTNVQFRIPTTPRGQLVEPVCMVEPRHSAFVEAGLPESARTSRLILHDPAAKAACCGDECEPF